MADDFLTLADIALINDQNNADIEVSNVLTAAPVVSRLAAVPATNGNIHKYLQYSGKPNVGFRSVNSGRDHDSSVDVQKTVTLEILDASCTVDKDLADSNPRGREYVVSREARRHLRAAFFKLEQQVFHGTTIDAGGFDGLDQLITNESLSEVDADSGNTATANTYTAVYVMHTMDDALAVVLGNDGNISIDPTLTQFIVDGTGKRYPVYATPISSYAGLQYGGIWDVVKIKNLGTSDGVSLTDDHIYQAIEKLPVDRSANLIAMSPTSLEQLRSSRTATNATGTPPPTPTEVAGIPIVATDAISKTFAHSA